MDDRLSRHGRRQTKVIGRCHAVNENPQLIASCDRIDEGRALGKYKSAGQT